MKKLFRVELKVEITDATPATYELVERQLKQCLLCTLDDGAQMGEPTILTEMIPILEKVK